MESLDPRRIGDTTKIQIQDGPGDFSVRGCQKRTCKRGKKKGAKLLCLALIYVAFVVFNVLHRVYNEINKQEGVEFDEVLRVKRDVISYGNGTSEPGNVCLYIIIFIKTWNIKTEIFLFLIFFWVGRVLFINFDVLAPAFLKPRKCKLIVYVILHRILVPMEFLLRPSLHARVHFNLML